MSEKTAMLDLDSIDTRGGCLNVEYARISAALEELTAAKAEIVDLLTVCQAVQRDLLLRAEPDWDGSGMKVVNLSAGFWDELNRVIGKHDDTAAKSFDALILSKQAEAIEEAADAFGIQGNLWSKSDLVMRAQRLRTQAQAAEKGGNDE